MKNDMLVTGAPGRVDVQVVPANPPVPAARPPAKSACLLWSGATSIGWVDLDIDLVGRQQYLSILNQFFIPHKRSIFNTLIKFLKVNFVNERKEELFQKADYGTASPEYHRRAL